MLRGCLFYFEVGSLVWKIKSRMSMLMVDFIWIDQKRERVSDASKYQARRNKCPLWCTKSHICWLDTQIFGPNIFAQMSRNTFDKKTATNEAFRSIENPNCFDTCCVCVGAGELSNSIHKRNRIPLQFRLKLSIENHLKHR